MPADAEAGPEHEGAVSRCHLSGLGTGRDLRIELKYDNQECKSGDGLWDHKPSS